MEISKGLILKGTAAAAAVATTTTGAIYNEEIGGFLSSVFSGEDADNSDQNPDSVSDTATAEKTGKNSLGLPDNWEWPTANNETKTKDLTIEQLKKINFDGKDAASDLSISTDTSTAAVSLTIEKVDGNSDFPQDFKFIFKTKDDKDVTITVGSASIALKKGMDLEFKIKATGNKWSLERAWDKTTLGAKVKLTCPKDSNSADECSFNTSETTNIFVSTSNKSSNASVTEGTGKIKVEEDQKGYNQGLRFTIEDANISVSGGSSGVNKLEKYETYEIKEIGESGVKKWFFARKNSAVQSINKKLKALGLPNDCKFDEDGTEKICENLNESKLKAINFMGKNGEDLTIDGAVSGLKLEMKRVSAGDKFPTDLKFTFKDFTADSITIKKASGTNNSIAVLKKGTNPEFKLNSSGKLEKAWNVVELGKKVGLDCSDSTKECSFEANKPIRVFEEESKKTIDAKVSDTTKKLEFTENEKDHNQGFKFVVKDNDGISLNSGGTVSSLVKANTSYEIKYQTDGWYLSKITNTPAA